MGFVHLHVHTEYSLLDGACKVKKMPSIIKDMGQTAVAKENASKAGFADRIDTCEGNILSDSTKLPCGYDAVWMSQFLDCFSLKQITKIIKKVVCCRTKAYVLYIKSRTFCRA